jgi:peptidyl-prolyl cis-trans isomerase D
LFVASNRTKNVVHRKTRDFADRAQNVEGFDKAVKADTLEKKIAKFELKASTAPQLYYNGLNLADEDRELVKSIFKLKEPGTTAVLEIGDYYIVACLKSINKAGSIPASDEDKIKEEARKVVVSNIILDNLKKVASNEIDLSKIAEKYNEEFKLANKPKKAIREHVKKQTLDKNTIGRKEEPEVVGTVFGIAKDKRSSAFVGENGIYIIEVLNKGTEATEKEEPVVAEGEEKPKAPIRVLADQKAKAKENEIKRDYIKALKEAGEVNDYRFRM